MSNLELLMMYVVGPAITIIASWITYVQGRKKTTAEVKSTELDNTEKAIEIWRKLAQDVTAQLNTRESMIVGMKEQMDRILIQNSELLDQNGKLLKQNKTLLVKVNTLENDLKEFQKKVN